jgi:hypothetical protein
MLNITTPDEINPIFTQLVADFRRIQVSRFPINVYSRNHGSLLVFEDSRFPTQNTRVQNIVGTLRDAGKDKKGKQLYEIRSRMINNEKYAEHNDDYYSKQTNDPKKIAKYMKDYFKPFTPLEIAQRSLGKFESHHESWKDELRWKLRDIINPTSEELLGEVLHLHAMGVEFKSDRFRKIITEGVPMYEEHRRRQAVKVSGGACNVFINPDESVQVTDNIASDVYQSLLEAPEYIQQQVAMLRLVEENSYIPEVGMKLGENTYWIYVMNNEN